MKKILSLSGAYGFLCTVLCFCILFTPTSTLAETVTVIDQAGRQVKVEQPVERVITTFIPATIFALSSGLKDCLVGASNKDVTSSIYEALIDPQMPPVLVGNRTVGLNLETISSLRPDLVILYGQKDGVRMADRLADLGIPALIIKPESLSDMTETLALIGQATGRTEHTDRVIAAMDALAQKVQDTVADAPQPKVYYAASDLLRTISGDMLQNEMIRVAGGDNTSRDTTGFFVSISREQLLAWNPSVILASDRLTEEALNKLNGAEYSSLPAIQKGNIHRIPAETYWDFPSPLALAGTLWMSSKIHPQLYKETEVQAEIDALYDTIFGAGFSAAHPHVVGRLANPASSPVAESVQ